MHKVLSRARAACTLLVVAAAAPLAAQVEPATPEVAAINTVLDFRLNWMGDSTRFDACSIFKSVGQPARFPAGILPALQAGLDRSDDPCAEEPASHATHRLSFRVTVDSVSTTESRALVYVTVRKGEQRYRELYELLNLTPGVRWGFDRVTISHAIREYPVRRPPRASARP